MTKDRETRETIFGRLGGRIKKHTCVLYLYFPAFFFVVAIGVRHMIAIAEAPGG